MKATWEYGPDKKPTIIITPVGEREKRTFHEFCNGKLLVVESHMEPTPDGMRFASLTVRQYKETKPEKRKAR